MAMDEKETGNLIGSDKVEGTAVYGADQNKIGSIERVMIDKVSGRVSYAVLAFGGFLGVGTRKIAVDWRMLRFPPATPKNNGMDKLIADLPRDQLRKAPVYKEGEPIVIIGGQAAPPPAAAPAPAETPTTPPAASPAPAPETPAQAPAPDSSPPKP